MTGAGRSRTSETEDLLDLAAALGQVQAAMERLSRLAARGFSTFAGERQQLLWMANRLDEEIEALTDDASSQAARP